MKCTIAVGKRRARKASLQISLSQPPRFHPPHTELNLVAEDSSGAMGSLVLNCIDLGLVPTTNLLFGKEYSFDRSGDSGTEIAESVFVGPDEDTLELSRLNLRFGVPDGKWLELEVDATCYRPPENEDVVVRVRALLELTDA
jgi:hypothetical protein